MSGRDAEVAGRIVFLMPVISQVRFHKRVEGLIEQGWDAHALAFERSYYEGKDPSFPVTRLGPIQPGRYGQRVWPLLKALPTVLRSVKRANILYAFGLDMAVLGLIAGSVLRTKVPVVYEVGDIRRSQLGNGIASAVLRGLDRWVCRRATVVVATSEGYVREYFLGMLGIKDRAKFQVVENKLPRGYLNPSSSGSSTLGSEGVVRIGYFGLLRCPRTLDILLRAAQMARGRLEILIRGYPFGIPDFERRVAGHDWVKYGGPYISPDELRDLYGRVDLVWGCYPYEGSARGNWMWARTNRFYEACAFGVPVLSSAGSEEARIVTELGIGSAIDLRDTDAAVASLLQLDSHEIGEWRTQVQGLDPRVYLDVGHHLALSNRLLERSAASCGSAE